MPKHRDSLRAIGAITGITAAVKPQFNSHEQCFPDEQVSEPCVLLVASLSHARNKNLNLLAALPLSTAIYLCSLSFFFFEENPSTCALKNDCTARIVPELL
jgi:hypothetical protein